MSTLEPTEATSITECGNRLRQWMSYCQETGTSLRSEAESAVAVWKWSRWWMWNPTPYWFQRNAYPIGKESRKPAASPDEHRFQTGFDAQGRVRVERCYSDAVRDTRRLYNETIVRHEADRVLLARFGYSADKKLERVSCCLTLEGRAILNCSTAPDAPNLRMWFERFDWRNPGEVRVYAGSQEAPGAPVRILAGVETVKFDTDGRALSVVKEEPDQRPWIKWTRPKKGVSIAALGRRVCSALKQRIVQVLKNWQAPGRVYCVAISYDDEGNNVFLPSVGVGLESEREKWKAEQPEKLKQYMWNPAEFANFASNDLNPDLPGLEEDVKILNQLVSEQDAGAKAVKLIRKLAKELGAEVDWSQVLPVTSDFCVYSVGTEMSDFEADLKACVGARRFKQLQRGGLIP